MKPVAIYLPQFHPVPENDRWWGKGFTEWTNVTKAEPLFKGHYQPRLPADLGFYDLRVIETIVDQASIAKNYGLGGFAFYHYWFKGKRLLNDPIDLILESRKPDFPFLLFWANETWSRRWLGEERDVLIAQEYSDEDDEQHASWLCEKAFSDPRYIKVNGKPVFVIYRPHDLPDINKTISIFRRVAEQKGFPGVYLVGCNAHSSKGLSAFDNILNFEPQLGLLKDAFKDQWTFQRWRHNFSAGVNSGKLKLYDYAEVKDQLMKRKHPEKFIPCPFVGWDNTARRGEKGVIMINQDADHFERSLRWAKEKVQEQPREEQLIFINAWNEWAEGNYLEPCQKFGYAFLERVRKVFNDHE
jgi:lipopolysaccharide biosynthesis protein